MFKKKGKENILKVDDFIVLSYEQLLKVNGAGGSSSGGSSGGAANKPSKGSGNNATADTPTSTPTDTSTSTPTKTPTDTTTSTPTDTTTNSDTGSKRVENSNAGVAGAKPGDTIQRSDGSIYTITQGDIDWAKKQVGSTSTSTGSSSGTSGNTTNAGSTTGSNGSTVKNPTNTDSTTGTSVTKPTNTGNTTNTESTSTSNRVENSNEGVAGAKPGDTIQRKDGTIYTLTQGDIDLAKNEVSKKDPQPTESIVVTESKEDTQPGESASTVSTPEETTLKKGQPAKNDGTKTDTVTDISNSISDNWEKQYNYTTGYRCDNWVEEVLDDAGYKSSDYLKGGTAASATVQDHIDELKKTGTEGVDYTTKRPTEDGAYVVFMDNGTINGKVVGEHAAILIVKDGKATFYDNSSGNGGTPTYVTDKDGKPTDTVSYYDQGVGATDGSVKWCYSDMYYQKIQ